MKTKHLLTNPVTHSHTHAHTAPPTGEAPPSPVCIAPKRAASFRSQFFIIQAKETQQHPATSYSHPLLSPLSLSPFLVSGFERIAHLKYYRRKASLCAAFFCVSEVTPQGQGVSWFCWAKPLETVKLPYTGKPLQTASVYVFCSLCTYVIGIMCMLSLGGGVRGYWGSMRWISILFTSLFTTNSAKLLRTTVRLVFTTTGRRALSLRQRKPCSLQLYGVTMTQQ